MTLTIIILSVLVIFLMWQLLRKKPFKVDYSNDWRILENRLAMKECAQNDYEKGIITKQQYRVLSHLFHPDFKNKFDYVPPERQKFEKNLRMIDSDFWHHYKINPDFVLPVNMIYELYKSFVLNRVQEEPVLVE